MPEANQSEASTLEPVFHWFLPTRGDSDSPGMIPAFGNTQVQSGRRLPTIDYLTQVVRSHVGSHPDRNTSGAI